MVEIWWHLPTEHLIQMTTVKREEFLPPTIWRNYRINRINTILTVMITFSSSIIHFLALIILCSKILQNEGKKKLINSRKTEANAGLLTRLFRHLITINLSHNAALLLRRLFKVVQKRNYLFTCRVIFQFLLSLPPNFHTTK